MILKIVSIFFFILSAGLLALHYGYAHYLAIPVVLSVFILPAVGTKFHGVSND